MRQAGQPDGKIRIESYAFFLAFFGVILFLSHLPLLGLKYFWDEADQYIPMALDIFHRGSFIPHSVLPIIHPPGVFAYLAAMWKLVGYSPAATRSAMLLMASFGALVAFLLSIELSKESGRGAPAFFAVALLCCSPIFFAQSIMANLDAPAMLFTTLALLLFLQDRIRLCAATCMVLVLVKETGIVVPMVFAAWMMHERRWRDAAWFLAPLVALAAWLGALYHRTGYWTGSPGFEQYNLYFPLHPVRLLVALSRRMYSLFFASFQWIGAFAIAFIWRTTYLFHSRSWRIAWTLASAQVLVVTVLGGAVLTRYLLPVMPIVFAAMALGLAHFPQRPQRICGAALIVGLAASNFINPPYPFPYEDNLAFADFVKLQTSGAEFLDHWARDARVTTAWPMNRELTQPELGFVSRAMDVQTLRNFTPQTLAPVDWNSVEVFVAFSRTWDPEFSLTHFAPVRSFWRHFYNFSPNSTRDDLQSRVPFPRAAHFERRGQWLDIYVNPAPAPVPPPVRAKLGRCCGPFAQCAKSRRTLPL
jgi:4-amino-4-deoxy-L-arabinose transferase-like glycosyltransferase